MVYREDQYRTMAQSCDASINLCNMNFAFLPWYGWLAVSLVSFGICAVTIYYLEVVEGPLAWLERLPSEVAGPFSSG